MPMMAYIKREAPELVSAAPRKRFKPAAEVEDTHVTELHELILQEGLLLKLSPAARIRIAEHPNAAAAYGKQLHKRIKSYKRPDNYSKPSLQDSINGYMAELVALSQFSDGARWVCFLSLNLSVLVYRSMEEYGQNLDGQPDSLLVSMLLKLGPRGLEQRLDIDGTETLSIGLLALEQRGKDFAKQRTYNYYPKTVGLVRTWRNPPGYHQKEHDSLKQKITTLNANAEKELQRPIDPKRRYSQRSTAHEIWSTLSDTLELMIPDIRHLSYLEGGLKLAFELIQFLGRQSFFYCDTKQFPGYVNRAVDNSADELLVELATRIKAEDPAFNPSKEVEMLQSQIEYLSELKIKSYFPNSFELLKGYAPELAKQFALEESEEITKKIQRTKAAVEKRYAQCKYDSKIPPADWLSKAMVDIIPDIKTLGSKPYGTFLASKLLLDLGESSFVPMVDKTGKPGNYGKRESDALADEALTALISSANASQTTYHELPWETRRRMWCERIANARAQLSEMGVHGYFEKSERLLRL